MRYLRSFIFWLFLVIFIIFLGSIAPFFKNKTRSFQKLVGFCSKLLLIFSFTKVKVEGELSSLQKNKPFLIAVNHSSFIDSFILLGKLPCLFRFTVHPAGFRFPLLGKLYKTAGYIGVGQKDFKSAALLIRAFKNREKVVVYSAAAAGETEGEFSQNLIRLSEHFKVPILPIAIRGASNILPLGKLAFGGQSAVVKIGKPFAITSIERAAKELKEEIIRLHSSAT